MDSFIVKVMVKDIVRVMTYVYGFWLGIGFRLCLRVKVMVRVRVMNMVFLG